MGFSNPTSADRFSVAAAASINDLTTGTIIGSMYIGSTANSPGVCNKGAGGNLQIRRQGTTLEFSIVRATTNLQANTAAGVLTSGQWIDFAAQWNTAGIATDQGIWTGSLTAPLTAIGAYGSLTAGTGAVTSNAANAFIIGTNAAANAPYTDGAIDHLAIYNRKLSLDEMRRVIQRPTPLSGCVGLWIFGVNGGANGSADLSGNGNNATKVGAPIINDVRPRGAYRVGAPISSVADYVAPVVTTGSSKRTNRRRRARVVMACQRGGRR